MECNDYPSLGATQYSPKGLFRSAASPSSAHPYLSHTFLWRWNTLLIRHSTSRITVILSNSAASHSIALPLRCLVCLSLVEISYSTASHGIAVPSCYLVQTWFGYSSATFSPEELVHYSTHLMSSSLILLIYLHLDTSSGLAHPMNHASSHVICKHLHFTIELFFTYLAYPL